jgi:hypothetical protein
VEDGERGGRRAGAHAHAVGERTKRLTHLLGRAAGRTLDGFATVAERGRPERLLGVRGLAPARALAIAQAAGPRVTLSDRFLAVVCWTRRKATQRLWGWRALPGLLPADIQIRVSERRRAQQSTVSSHRLETARSLR